MSKVEIYTDGACSGNPGPGGWGAILVYGDVHGQVNALLFSAATMALFDRPSQPAGSKQGGAFSCLMKC